MDDLEKKIMEISEETSNKQNEIMIDCRTLNITKKDALIKIKVLHEIMIKKMKKLINNK